MKEFKYTIDGKEFNFSFSLIGKTTARVLSIEHVESGREVTQITAKGRKIEAAKTALEIAMAKVGAANLRIALERAE